MNAHQKKVAPGGVLWRGIMVLTIILTTISLLPGPAAGAADLPAANGETVGTPLVGASDLAPAPPQGADPLSDPDLPPGATEEWWAAVRGDIRQDMYGVDSIITGLPTSASTGLSTSPDWTATGENNVDVLGFFVATAGDINGDGYGDAIVGAYLYDTGVITPGKAYVYHGSATGLSTSPNWTAEGETHGDGFGYSVATAGDVNNDGYADVIVGAPFNDDNGNLAGKAYVYHGSGTGLSATANWTATGEITGSYYGICVATAGDINSDGYSDVVVGAEGYTSMTGRVYVYHGSGAGLSTSPNWTATGKGDLWASFGLSVTTAGDVNGDGYADVIIGSWQYFEGLRQGKVYVWHGSNTGLGDPLNADWTATGENNADGFGWSVATAGDVNGDGYADVIVGAPYWDITPQYSNEGKVYVYYGSGAGLSATADWTATGEIAGSYFGYSVAAGDVNGDGYADILVGAFTYPNLGRQGKVYVWHGSNTGLGDPLNADWTATGENNGDDFGRSVTTGDMNGDGYSDVFVGAPGYDDGGNTYAGKAYVYHGASTGLSATDAWTATGENNGDGFGYFVATAGDVNGDGYADVIVGAPGYPSANSQGKVNVYHGSSTGLNTTPDWTATGENSGDSFGYSVATAGDVNNDGYADVIVGAYTYGSNQGKAYVYHGSNTGLSASANWTATGENSGDSFGVSVATVGELNGDGYADVVIGAPGYDNGGNTDAGKVYVWHGSATGLGNPLNADWTATGESNGDGFGYSVATAGDVNRDSYADVIVGAYTYGSNQGKAYVWHGSNTRLGDPLTPNWTATGENNSDLFGVSVATAGDVNGDGYADIIVGAYTYGSSQGKAYVYHGASTGLSASANWTATGENSGDSFGYSVATAGDVNGDGYADVIVGAYTYGSSQGKAYVYHGSNAGLSASANWTATGENSGDSFGVSVATAGDVNGDGYADDVVGTPGYLGGNDQGKAYLYYGNGGDGLDIIPRQRRGDDSNPVAHLGMFDSLISFRLASLGRIPFGRGQVKLEWEVKALYEPFNGSGTQQSASWADTGVAGVQLNELVSSPPAGMAHHWRVRLLYHPVTTPFQQRSRWLTMPWNGWNEQDLRPSEPTAAKLLSFTARPTLGGIELVWETASEVDNLGFNLYRSTSPNALGEQLNEALIPSPAPGEGLGASYEFLDETVLPNVAYYYTLEDVNTFGLRTQHGPVVLTLWQVYLPLVVRQ